MGTTEPIVTDPDPTTIARDTARAIRDHLHLDPLSHAYPSLVAALGGGWHDEGQWTQDDGAVAIQMESTDARHNAHIVVTVSKR